MPESLFGKVARLQQKLIPVNFTKFLRKPLENLWTTVSVIVNKETIQLSGRDIIPKSKT